MAPFIADRLIYIELSIGARGGWGGREEGERCGMIEKEQSCHAASYWVSKASSKSIYG